MGPVERWSTPLLSPILAASGILGEDNALATAESSSIDFIRKLISYDTTSRNSNLEIIHYIRDYLDGLGIESLLVPDETGTKANLYATLGPQDKPGIILSGHTDVVPIDGQDWHTDPFNLQAEDGKLYGRGTCDMKSFVAICLAYAPKFLKRGLNIPIHLAFSYDEEVGCIGVRSLTAKLANEIQPKPMMCIVGEPTSMAVIIGHKGKHSYECHVHGLEAHSSLAPQGVNAVEYAAEFITHLKGMARHIRKKGPFDDLYDINHTTVHTGVVNGGTALNIVPKDCRFEFEFRCIAGHDGRSLYEEAVRYAREELEPEMKAIDASTGFSFKELSVIEGLDIDPGEEVVTLVKTLAGRNDHAKVAFGTEAGLFQQDAGIPTVVCGPGSIDQAHKPNEFVAMDQIDKCHVFFNKLMDHVCK